MIDDETKEEELEEDKDAPDEEKPEDTGPSPMDVILEKFAEIRGEIDSLKPKTPEDQEREEKAKDPDYGFDPKRIVQASGQAAQSGYLTLRKAEAEIRKTFPELEEAEVEDIVGQLASLPPDVLVETVTKKQGHLAMGYAHLGMAVKSGKVKPDGKKAAKPTKVGGDAPREGAEDSNSLIAEYEKHYGKPTKAQRERMLLAGA